MWHTLSYSTFNVPPDSRNPDGKVHRPLLKLDLVHGAKRVPCYAIVDSGADFCIFPLAFGTALGFDPLTTTPVNAAGVGNGAVPIFHWDVTLDFGGVLVIPTLVGFSDGVNAIGLGLLGQLGFFDRVNVHMNYRKKEFYIEVDDHQPGTP